MPEVKHYMSCSLVTMCGDVLTDWLVVYSTLGMPTLNAHHVCLFVI